MRAVFEKIEPGAMFSFVTFAPENDVFRSPFHYHPEIEITRILSSHGRRLVGDHLGGFEPGDLVMLGKNLPHFYQNQEEASLGPKWARAQVIQFRSDCLGSGFWLLPEVRRIRNLLHESARGIAFSGRGHSQACQVMDMLFSEEGPGRIARLIELLDRLSHVRRREFLASPHFQPQLSTHETERVNRVYRILSENFGDEISMADVARSVGMHPAALSRFFRKKTGRTPTRFLQEVRIGHACRLLQETDRSILDVCHASGFQNLSNFNRRFRLLRKCTPRDFRKMHRNELGA